MVTPQTSFRPVTVALPVRWVERTRPHVPAGMPYCSPKEESRVRTHCRRCSFALASACVNSISPLHQDTKGASESGNALAVSRKYEMRTSAFLILARLRHKRSRAMQAKPHRSQKGGLQHGGQTQTGLCGDGS